MFNKHIDDVAKAMFTTEENLRIFGNMFKRKYMRGLRKLWKELKVNPNDRTRKRLLGEYCVKALLIPSTSQIHRFNRKRLAKYCKDAVYPSSFPSEVPDLRFSEMSKESYNDRVCNVYDFKRKLKLFEIE